MMFFCWQSVVANGHCFTDAKMAMSSASFLSYHNAHPSVHSGTRLSNVVHSTKPSVLPLQPGVQTTSAVSSVTSVKTQLAAVVNRPLLSTTTNTSCTTWPTGQLLLMLKQ